MQLPQIDLHQTRWNLTLGITIWFLYLNLVYGLTSVACRWGWFPFTIGGLSGLQFVDGIITLIALVPVVLLIYFAWDNWRQYQTDKSRDNPRMLQQTEQDRRPLGAFTAMLINSLLALFVIMNFAPILALAVCNQG